MPVIGPDAFHALVLVGIFSIVGLLFWIATSVQTAKDTVWRLRTIERIVRRIARK